MFVGYSEVSKAYQCYDSHARIVLISKDVKFDEGIFIHSPSTCVPTTSEISLEPLSSGYAIIEISDPIRYTIPVASSESAQLLTLPSMDQLPATSGPVEPLSFESPGSSSINPAGEMVRVYTHRPLGYVPTPVFNSPAPDLRRSTRPCETSSRLREFVTTVTTVDEFINFIHSTNEPLHYQDAASNPLWMQTMTEEMEAISQNQTWILVDPPPGCKPISTKWIYKIKSGPDGSSPRYKARLVARGDMQQVGIDYQETFAPVCKWGIMRNVVSLAAQRGWSICHMDVKSAFLNGTLEEEVYLCQLQGFVVKGHEH